MQQRQWVLATQNEELRRNGVPECLDRPRELRLLQRLIEGSQILHAQLLSGLSKLGDQELPMAFDDASEVTGRTNPETLGFRTCRGDRPPR